MLVECAYVVLDGHVTLVDFRYWEIDMIPKSIDLLTELKKVYLSIPSEAIKHTMDSAKMKNFIPMKLDSLQKYRKTHNILTKIDIINSF